MQYILYQTLDQVYLLLSFYLHGNSFDMKVWENKCIKFSLIIFNTKPVDYLQYFLFTDELHMHA